MKRHTSLFLSFILALGLVLGGCGGTGNQSQPPVAQSEDADEGQGEGGEAQEEGAEAEASPSGTKAAQEGGTVLPAEDGAPVVEEVVVRGIYVSAPNMNGAKFDKLYKLVQDTDLNAMVIDVKNDSGQVTYQSALPIVQNIGADAKPIIPDLPEKIRNLKSNGIYTIGRIVVFKDPYLASKKPEWAMQKKKGGVWKDAKGISWVDPYQEDVWNYNIALAQEAAALGFDEIQFDYVRFPDNAKKVDAEVRFSQASGLNKMETIQQFLAKAKEQLPKVKLSADVFGLTTSAKDDMGIGQKWELIASTVDIISPMIYPSHYAKGEYGIGNPDTEPYRTVSSALQDAVAKNNAIVEEGFSPRTAQIRPWYQDFTATWVKPHLTYGAKEIREQVRAGEEKGIKEFLLWNPSGEYSYK